MDIFSNMLTNIKNGQAISLLSVRQLKTSINIQVLYVLMKLGFIRGYSEDKTNPNYIIILLKYYNGFGIIRNIKKISTVNRRVYITYDTLAKIKDYKLKILVLSTSLGILSNDEALKLKVGGELLFIIY